MNKFFKISMLVVAVMLIVSVFSVTTLAENTGETVVAESASTESNESNVTSMKAIAAGAVILVVASVGAVMMGLSITKSAESIARQPEAAGNIRTNMMLGLVFIETAIIYALIVAILIVFVL